MSLSINSIVIRISAKAFNASFELSQLQVYSVNTSWSISDLRFTRIQDPQRGEVTILSSLIFRRPPGCCVTSSLHCSPHACLLQILTFKEISWQMIRIEADAIQSAEHEMLSAPIRLITNQSKIRVTLKRRVSYTHTLTQSHMTSNSGLTRVEIQSAFISILLFAVDNNPSVWSYRPQGLEQQFIKRASLHSSKNSGHF